MEVLVPEWLLQFAQREGIAAVVVAVLSAAVAVYRIRSARASKPAASPAPLAPDHAPPSSAVPLSSQRRRLLIVDDDPAACAALRRILGVEFPAVEVLVAGDVPEAKAVLHGPQPPDVAIIDCYLPGGNGWDLAATVPRRTRVILMSGAVDERLLPQLAEDTTAVPLRKPIDVDELIRVVRVQLSAPSRASTPAIRE